MPESRVAAAQSRVVEISLGAAPDDPWAELDVVVTEPGGATLTVPAFIRDGVWHVRYSSELLGVHPYESDAGSGEIEITARGAGTSLRDRGPVRVASDQRHFAHADGSPFLWVGDTWWHGFVTEKISDDEFRDFARQRVVEGFSVIQLVVLAPEAGPFDAAARSRTGWPWDEGFTGINLAWWDDADHRIATLLDEDLLPCIVGSWGYHLGMMDDRQLRRHWREMVARWGALPVTWCLAGEPSMGWYDQLRTVLATVEGEKLDREARGERLRSLLRPLAAAQLAKFNNVARDLRTLDPFHRPTTTHIVPGELPWMILDDESNLDFWMLQTGHAGHRDLPAALAMLDESFDRTPTKPVVNGEPSYEGIAGSNWEDIQRLQFWSHMLSGAAGHTYGAHGVWAMNTEEFPAQFSGAAPTWKEAKSFSGSRGVGAGGRILRTLEWWTLTPRPDLVDPHQTVEDRFAPYAAELGDGTRLAYLPSYAFYGGGLRLLDLGDRPWRLQFIDLGPDRAYPEFTGTPDEEGNLTLDLGLLTRPSWGDVLVIARPA